MKAAVIVFPGSNCDRDLAEGFHSAGAEVAMVWHKETELPAGIDVVGIPGGFSFGDYLRCGAIAARAPIMRSVLDYVARGGHLLGVCNGFQVLVETGVLPGALMRNAALKFICADVALTVGTADSPFTGGYARGETIRIPVAHHDGNYFVDAATTARLEAEDRIAFRYVSNPNGSAGAIAGVLSENRRVLGLMPHPERAVDPVHGGADGARLFAGLAEVIAGAPVGALQGA